MGRRIWDGSLYTSVPGTRIAIVRIRANRHTRALTFAESAGIAGKAKLRLTVTILASRQPKYCPDSLSEVIGWTRKVSSDEFDAETATCVRHCATRQPGPDHLRLCDLRHHYLYMIMVALNGRWRGNPHYSKYG